MNDTDPTSPDFLEHLVQGAPMAFAFHGTDLRYIRVNSFLAQINGIPPEAHIGRLPSEVFGHPIGDVIEARLRDVLESGLPQEDRDFADRLPALARPGQIIHASWFPVRRNDGQGFVGVAALARDVTDQTRTEAALLKSRDRTARLQQATARLATTITVPEVLQTITALGQESIGAYWSGVALLDEAKVLRFAHGGQPTGVAMAWPSMPLEAATATSEAVRGGQPVYVDDREQLLSWLPYEHIRSFLETSVEQAWAAIPLTGSAGPLGALRFAFDEPRRLDPDERRFLEALSGQCAIALERAQLFEREHELAVGLQRSLLPSVLPSVHGLRLDARYLPAAADSAVGGDWYDAFLLADGRVAFAIGDVMGHGIEAAAGMGRMRTALRALALTDPDPASVLAGLDRLFAGTEPEEQLVTVAYGVVDPSSGEVVAADAGHPPLAVLTASGDAYLVDAGPSTTPLGIPERRTYGRWQMGPGDVLVGFTDGLVERRDRPLGEGLDAVVDALRAVRNRDLGAVLDHLLDELAAHRHREDDVTILALGRADA